MNIHNDISIVFTVENPIVINEIVRLVSFGDTLLKMYSPYLNVR